VRKFLDSMLRLVLVPLSVLAARISTGNKVFNYYGYLPYYTIWITSHNIYNVIASLNDHNITPNSPTLPIASVFKAAMLMTVGAVPRKSLSAVAPEVSFNLEAASVWQYGFYGTSVHVGDEIFWEIAWGKNQYT
jgi:hypothetical protein